MRFEFLLLVVCASLIGLAQPYEYDSLAIEVDVDIEFTKVYNGQNNVAIRVFEKGMPGVPVEDVLCNLHLSHISPLGMQGSLITDENGRAVFPLVGKFEEARKSLDEYLFICRIAHDIRFVSIDKERRFKKSFMNVAFQEDRSIHGQLTEILPDSSQSPVQDAEISVYVLKDGEYQLYDLGHHQTDESGHFSLTLDDKIQGDSLGMVQLRVQAVHPSYGTIQYLSTQPWGLTPKAFETYQRSQHWKYRVIALSILVLAIGVWVFRRRLFTPHRAR